jgi:hypothetical protein
VLPPTVIVQATVLVVVNDDVAVLVSFLAHRAGGRVDGEFDLVAHVVGVPVLAAVVVVVDGQLDVVVELLVASKVRLSMHNERLGQVMEHLNAATIALLHVTQALVAGPTHVAHSGSWKIRRHRHKGRENIIRARRHRLPPHKVATRPAARSPPTSPKRTRGCIQALR